MQTVSFTVGAAETQGVICMGAETCADQDLELITSCLCHPSTCVDM